MKKKLLVFLVFSITLWFSFETYAEKKAVTDDQAPSAYLPENIYNFGQVVEGTNVSHEFGLLNKGTGPLRIEKVSSG